MIEGFIWIVVSEGLVHHDKKTWYQGQLGAAAVEWLVTLHQKSDSRVKIQVGTRGGLNHTAALQSQQQNLPPESSTTSPNGTSSWEPSVQIEEPMGDCFKPKPAHLVHPPQWFHLSHFLPLLPLLLSAMSVPGSANLLPDCANG